MEERSLTGAELQIVEFAKDIWRSFNPTPLLSYSRFLQILFIHSKFENIQGWRLHNVSGETCSAVQSLCQ